MPERDVLLKLYIDENRSVAEICEKYHKSRSVVEGWLHNYDIKKSKDLHQKCIQKSNLEKYGVKNISELDSTKRKVKDTNISKFGKDYYSQTDEFKNRVRETCIEKYGVDNPSKSPVIQQKIFAKNKEIFGEEVPFKSELFKQKVRKNMKENYGVDWTSQMHLSKEVLDIIHNKDLFEDFVRRSPDKSSHYLAEMLGVSVSLILQVAHGFGCFELLDSYTSSYELEIKEFLANYGIDLEKTSKIIYPYEIDLYNSEHKIGIEFNGDYWHSSAQNKEEFYHQKKSKRAEEVGVKLFHIFEYEWNREKEKIKQQLLRIFNVNICKLYARKCSIREIPVREKNDFLEKYHLQGSDKSSVKLGLYFENDLVSVMTFRKPRFNKNYSWEIIRYCSKDGITVVGGGSKLLKYFRERYGGSIITYSDYSKFSGAVYGMLGFRFVRLTTPNYVWINLSTRDVKPRYQCQMKNEEKIMSARGYVKIYDCGNKVWELVE